jgi:hypothetical protein
MSIQTVDVDLRSEPTDEEHRVLTWRLEQFTRLGFDAAASWRLADSPADLGEARTLTRRGCSPELALRILF